MSRSAVVAGATGLVGGFLVRELLSLPDYARVTALARRPLPISDPKLRQVVVDYDDLEASAADLAAADAFCCLGTTIRAAGSREAFERVDLEYVERFARACAARGAEQFLLVSSSGADADSPIFYSRVKGRAEQAAARAFSAAHAFRPALLLGRRDESRPAERLAQLVMPALSPLLVGPLRRYRAIEAETVARAMARWALRREKVSHVLESDAIAELGAGSRAG